MADENPQTPVQSPAVPPVQSEATPSVISQKDIEGKTPEEIIKIVAEKSEKVGSLETSIKQLEEYRQITQPFIETIVADPELMKILEEKHTKRINPAVQPTPNEPDKDKKPVPQPTDDTRRALEAQIVAQFERERGLDKLEGDTRKEMSVKIGQELMEMLDPGGNRNYNEILAGISLEKLPKYLDKAYNLATMDEKLKKTAEEAKAQVQIGATGQISSIPSIGGTAEMVNLTPSERETAKKMGITDEKWLERKKQIIERKEKEAGLR